MAAVRPSAEFVACWKIRPLRFLPDSPMNKNHECVKVSSQSLGRSSPGFNPPIFRAVKDAARNREGCLGPDPQFMPDLLCESTVNEEVGAAFDFQGAEGTYGIMRPPFGRQIIRRRTPLMNR